MWKGYKCGPETMHGSKERCDNTSGRNNKVHRLLFTIIGMNRKVKDIHVNHLINWFLRIINSDFRRWNTNPNFFKVWVSNCNNYNKFRKMNLPPDRESYCRISKRKFCTSKARRETFFHVIENIFYCHCLSRIHPSSLKKWMVFHGVVFSFIKKNMYKLLINS